MSRRHASALRTRTEHGLLQVLGINAAPHQAGHGAGTGRIDLQGGQKGRFCTWLVGIAVKRPTVKIMGHEPYFWTGTS
jgi:hypothetical protein